MRTRPIHLALSAALALTVAGCGSGAALVGVHDAPPQVTTTAPFTPESAEQIAERVLTKADEAQAATAKEAEQLRAEALTGSALAVADAASRLEPGSQPKPTAGSLTRSDPPKVLAVSRGNAWPRVILVQTTTDGGAAQLNLLTSPDARTPFRLSSRATMHPGAQVAALDSLTQGSPLLTDPGQLATAPDALVKEYAASLAYPKPAAAPDIDSTDPFSVAVPANAADQAKAFGKLATLTQKHTPQPARTVSIALRGGGALVFALMERTDTITLKSGGKSLTPSAEFQRLVGKKTLTKSAELKSYETVVFTVPTEGKASVVAADEVLYSAKGA